MYTKEEEYEDHKSWIEALDGQIIAHKRKVLIGKGNVSHQQAIAKAEKEFEIYRKREMDLLESDFDREIKELKEKHRFTQPIIK